MVSNTKLLDDHLNGNNAYQLTTDIHKELIRNIKPSNKIKYTNYKWSDRTYERSIFEQANS